MDVFHTRSKLILVDLNCKMSSKRKFEAQEQIEAEDEKIGLGMLIHIVLTSFLVVFDSLESSAKRIKNKNEEDVSDGKDEKKTEKNGMQ